MAILHSEDQEVPSWLEMAPGDYVETEASQTWQKLNLVLRSGRRDLALSANDRESSLLCREPDDELLHLINMIDELIEGKRDKVLFEPAEPFFELNIGTTRQGSFTVHTWIDSGDASTGFYRWDAIGVRFFTTVEHMRNFANQMRKEFLGDK
jgi:hypothetical protein